MGSSDVSCDATNVARAMNTSIRCRYYDTTETVRANRFKIQEFSLDEVVIGGLENYFESTSSDFTSHNELYLIKPEGSITLSQLPTFRCIKVYDNEALYDPNEPYMGTVPADNAGWQIYTPNNHECGADQLKDAYYKFIDPTGSFYNVYDVFVDQWGKRCIFDDDVWELKLDRFGKANHCQDKDLLRQRKYLLRLWKAQH